QAPPVDLDVRISWRCAIRLTTWWGWGVSSMPWRSISLHVMESPEHQKRSIREYMAGQCRDEEIVHLEKVASERIYGEKHDVWDVHTDKGRWWVITNMTNLYSQSEFKSMDYALSFHIGLCARIGSRQQRAASEDPNARFLQ